MSAKHLSKGSSQPPKVDGKLRLYSMEFCPFAERVRLVLLAKGIAHDTVNVHLKEKPDWIFKLHPEGKVPALDTGSEVLIESLDISDYLDEKYPNPPLYPSDPEKREKDKAFIKEECGNIITLYFKGLHNPNNLTLDEHLKEILPQLQKIETELKKRGVFFGGEKPNMIDYMLWPFGERAQLFEMSYKQKMPDAAQFPSLYAWCKAMRTLRPVQETVTSPERLFKLFQLYMAGGPVDYDSV